MTKEDVRIEVNAGISRILGLWLPVYPLTDKQKAILRGMQDIINSDAPEHVALVQQWADIATKYYSAEVQ